MAIDVYFTKQAKKRNSTYQFSTTGVQPISCTLKAETSLDRPTFLLSSASFDYNLAKWDSRYYFIEEIKSVRNNQWEVTCVIDALATCKTELLAQPYFVAYAADSSLKDNMIADTRIPVKKEFTESHAVDSTISTALPMYHNQRTYFLVVNGQRGTETYIIDRSMLSDLLQNVSTWAYNMISGFDNTDISGAPYDFSTVENAIESLGKMLNQSGFLGNAYADAVNNIISCIGLPFKYSEIVASVGTAATFNIHLGQFDTGVTAHRLDPDAESSIYISSILTVPTIYTDWRRANLVDYTLGLPGVGVVDLPSDLMAMYDRVGVVMGLNFTTGDLTYTVLGYVNQTPVPDKMKIIGIYSGNFAEQIPIGVSQRASLNQIGQAVVQGVTKTAAALINPFNPSVMGGLATGALAGVEAVYNVANAASTYSNTTISKASGGTGYAVTYISINAVERYLTQSQDDFAVTMGYPVQRVLSSLTGYTGFVQCANAHASVDADAGVVDAIDTYLNNGFYIE